MIRLLHSFDQRRQALGNFIGSKAANQSDSTGLVLGVECFDQIQNFARRELGTDLDSDRVLDSLEIFNMSPIEMASAIADPRKVRAHVVPTVSARHAAGLSLFVVKMQAFM